MLDWEKKKRKKKKNSVGRTRGTHLHVHEVLDEPHSVLKLLIKRIYFDF